jgi:hypothetical protein
MALAVRPHLGRMDLASAGSDLEAQSETVEGISLLVLCFDFQRNGEGAPHDAGLPVARDDVEACESRRLGAATERERSGGAGEQAGKRAGTRGGHRSMT